MAKTPKNKTPKQTTKVVKFSLFGGTRTLVIVLIIALILGFIFFGSPIFNIFAILFNFIGKIFTWFASALKWLGKFLNWFGLGG